METNLPDVYAAGDCVVTYHRLLEADTYLPLGTTAHKQGRIAGENAVGGDRSFEGSLGTQVVKVFDLAAARTGLRDHEAAAAGLDPLTVESRAYDHKVYYPGAHEITIRLTGDPESGRLLGAQLVGHDDTEVAKRVDVAAAALYHGMTVDALNDLDLSYTPPFGSPWDPLQCAPRNGHESTSLCRHGRSKPEPGREARPGPAICHEIVGRTGSTGVSSSPPAPPAGRPAAREPRAAGS